MLKNSASVLSAAVIHFYRPGHQRLRTTIDERFNHPLISAFSLTVRKAFVSFG